VILIILKLIFYLCLAWLILLTIITVVAMAISGMEAAQAFVKSYFETWYSGFAAVFVLVRIVESFFVTSPQNSLQS
jgi:uncharacterized membrane protein